MEPVILYLDWFGVLHSNLRYRLPNSETYGVER